MGDKVRLIDCAYRFDVLCQQNATKKPDTNARQCHLTQELEKQKQLTKFDIRRSVDCWLFKTSNGDPTGGLPRDGSALKRDENVAKDGVSGNLSCECATETRGASLSAWSWLPEESVILSVLSKLRIKSSPRPPLVPEPTEARGALPAGDAVRLFASKPKASDRDIAVA